MKKNSTLAEAVQFANSMRGQYIMAQALDTAIKAMNKVPVAQKERSNINDMKFLLDNLYPMWKGVLEVIENGSL